MVSTSIIKLYMAPKEGDFHTRKIMLNGNRVFQFFLHPLLKPSIVPRTPKKLIFALGAMVKRGLKVKSMGVFKVKPIV